MSRIKKPIIGDIYEVPLEDGTKGYVQYIANDVTQLNSDVIRVFKRREKTESISDLEEILDGDVEFYAHVTGMEFGEKDGSWKKIGHSDNVGDLKKPFFRTSSDYGKPSVKVSKEWYVWRINDPKAYVGRLEGENLEADEGSALPPAWVVQRMNTGRYQFFYPDHK